MAVRRQCGQGAAAHVRVKTMLVREAAAQCASSVSFCGLGSAAQFVIQKVAKTTLCRIHSREQMKTELIIRSLGREPKHRLQCGV